MGFDTIEINLVLLFWCLVRYPFWFTLSSHSLQVWFFSSIFYGYHTVNSITFCIFLMNLSNAWLCLTRYPFLFTISSNSLRVKNVWQFFIFNFWFSVLVFSKIFSQIHFIFAFLAGITYFLAIYRTNLRKIEYLVRYSFKFK